MGHIKFDSDDEDMDGMQAPQPSTSAPAGPPGTLKLPVCCGSARVDFNFNDPCYVFRVLPNTSGDLIAASVSNNTVKLYQPSGPQLSLVGELRGHTGTITDLSFCSTSQPYTVMSSSTDGTIIVWDVRNAQPIERYEVRGQEVFTHSSLEHVLAAGTTGEVLFWDRRSRKPLANLDDTHAEDVTQVRFHSSGRIISGSIDGLIAVHDVSKSFNDDDVFQAAINISNSVEEFGMYGPDGGRLWVRTGTETIHLWEWLRGTDEDAAGGDMQFADFPTARDMATQACAASSAASLLPQVDYFVGCHYDTPTNQLFLVSGHNEGPVAFVPILEQPGPQGNMVAAAMACPVMALSGGHSSIVRSLHCMREGTMGPLCVTGGEDALVCMWTLDQELVNAAAAGAAGEMPSGLAASGRSQQRLSPGPDRQHAQERIGSKKKRPSPY